MEMSRRDFLKLSGAASTGVLTLSAMCPEVAFGAAGEHVVLKKRVGETTTICPFCGAGCGFLVAAENGKVINVEGDPDHPVNGGGACAKGGGLRQVAADNPRRLSKVLYRAPGGSKWEEKTWEWALDEIAKRIKTTRDGNWKAYEGDLVVNRTEAIASLGGAALDNEECYLLAKMARSLGVVYLEHQARI